MATRIVNFSFNGVSIPLLGVLGGGAQQASITFEQGGNNFQVVYNCAGVSIGSARFSLANLLRTEIGVARAGLLRAGFQQGGDAFLTQTANINGAAGVANDTLGTRFTTVSLPQANITNYIIPATSYGGTWNMFTREAMLNSACFIIQGDLGLGLTTAVNFVVFMLPNQGIKGYCLLSNVNIGGTQGTIWLGTPSWLNDWRSLVNDIRRLPENLTRNIQRIYTPQGITF